MADLSLLTAGASRSLIGIMCHLQWEKLKGFCCMNESGIGNLSTERNSSYVLITADLCVCCMVLWKQKTGYCENRMDMTARISPRKNNQTFLLLLLLPEAGASLFVWGWFSFSFSGSGGKISIVEVVSGALVSDSVKEANFNSENTRQCAQTILVNRHFYIKLWFLCTARNHIWHLC